MSSASTRILAVAVGKFAPSVVSVIFVVSVLFILFSGSIFINFSMSFHITQDISLLNKWLKTSTLSKITIVSIQKDWQAD